MIGKRNPNGQFPHRNCVEYIPSVWKNSLLQNRFWINSQRWFRHTLDWEWGCRILGGYRSRCMLASTYLFGTEVLHNWMKMDLKKWETVLSLRRTSMKRHARFHTFSQRLIGDQKFKSRAFSHISDFYWKWIKQKWIKWTQIRPVLSVAESAANSAADEESKYSTFIRMSQ